MNKNLFLSLILLFSSFAWAKKYVAPQTRAFIKSIEGSRGFRAKDIKNKLSKKKNYIPWYSRHGMSSSSYQSEFDKQNNRGYRLQYISGYNSSGSAKYNAIWEKKSGSALSARHGMTANAYQQEFDSHLSQGFRLKLVNGYTVNGIDYYAAIWDKSPGPALWVARHGLTSNQYQSVFNQYVSQGYRLVHVSGYGTAGAERFAGIWHKTNGPLWSASHGLSEASFYLENASKKSYGYQLKTLENYSISGYTKYVAIWEKTQKVQEQNFSLSGSKYQNLFDDLRHQGFRPTSVSGNRKNYGVRFASVWKNTEFSRSQLDLIDNIVQNEMQNKDIPAVSIAISNKGRLVFAKAFGLANISAGKSANVSSVFRIASISKPITSAAILKLVDNQQIALTDRVFGPNSILGNDYTSNYQDQRFMDITVKQLLQHTAGLWGGENDPMFQYPGYSQFGLIREHLKHHTLLDDPGSVYRYSNFGYLILGRVIGKVTGQKYRNWVRENILAPSGAFNIDIANNSYSNPLPNEVRYYDNSFNPYNLNISRMDSHGGWASSAKDLVAFMVHIDGMNKPLDIISHDSYIDMGIGSDSNNGYGLGLAVNSIGNRLHGGGLPGSQSILVSASNKMSWAALANSRDGDPDLDGMMRDIINGISNWPLYDLFPKSSASGILKKTKKLKIVKKVRRLKRRSGRGSSRTRSNQKIRKSR